MGENQVYPKRQAYFAHRYCRLLTKTCAAQEIGHVAFVLCVTVAHQEDAKHYTGAVTFFNEQLMALVGVSKWESLSRARERAVKAGWLCYEPGNRGQRMPGRYWVMTPEHLEALNDSPCDETQYPANGDSVESQYPPKGERKGEWTPSQPPAKGDREGERRGDREGEHSTLSLSLSKKRAHTFVKPSIKEVRAYCLDRKNTVDPQRFLDHYESNGWRVGRNAMKSWKAAVRTWEKNGFSDSNGEAKKSEPLVYRA